MGSRHKRSASDHGEELTIEDEEELEAELRSVLDEMSAKDLLELSNELSEEDLNELTEEDESSDVTGIAVVDNDLNSRSKRGIFLTKKHLLKKLLKKGLPGPGPLGFLPLIKKIPGPIGLAPLVIKKALGIPVKKAVAAPLVKAGLGIPIKKA